MDTSKISLCDRLRAEGRWDEASKFKDAALREFKAKGMKRHEASDAAWEAMEKAFPPEEPEEPPPADAPESVHVEEATRCVSDCSAGSPTIPETWGEIPESAPFDVEVDWVHQNRVLVVEERPGGPSRLHWDRARSPAPSYGAVNLMEFAATNRKGFMDLLMRVKPGAGEAEDSQIVKQERMSIGEIKRILGQFQRQAEEATIRDLQENTSSTIQAKVHETVKGWENRFKLPLTDDAREDLEAHFGRFAQNCMDAGGGTLESSTAALPPESGGE